ncbi:MAG TPA: PLDc N-terminal domain-containing protein [Micromonosporaceae bacterium]
MLFIDASLLLLALWVFCLIDVIVVDEYRVRNLPKGVWLLIVLLLPDVGSILWLVAGRPWESRTRPSRSRTAREFPEYDRPGRHVAQNPDDDEEFLRQVRARAEEQRRRARQEREAREAREAAQEREAREQDGVA